MSKRHVRTLVWMVGAAGVVLPVPMMPRVVAETAQTLVVSDQLLLTLARDVRPLVERAAGGSFRRLPEFQTATGREIIGPIADSLAGRFRDHASIWARDQAMWRAEAAALEHLGFYSPERHRIYIVSENLVKTANQLKRPRIASRETVRALLIHELVHALDEEQYRLASREGKSWDEETLLYALYEGHASHVTRMILVTEGRGDLFELVEQIPFVFPTELAEKFGFSRQDWDEFNALTRFAYVTGRQFFDRLAERGRPDCVSRALQGGVGEKTMILDPDRFCPKLPAAATRIVSPGPTMSSRSGSALIATALATPLHKTETRMRQAAQEQAGAHQSKPKR